MSSRDAESPGGTEHCRRINAIDGKVKFLFVAFLDQKLDLLHRVVVLDDHPGKEWLQPFYELVLNICPYHTFFLLIFESFS